MAELTFDEIAKNSLEDLKSGVAYAKNVTRDDLARAVFKIAEAIENGLMKLEPKENPLLWQASQDGKNTKAGEWHNRSLIVRRYDIGENKTPYAQVEIQLAGKENYLRYTFNEKTELTSVKYSENYGWEHNEGKWSRKGDWKFLDNKEEVPPIFAKANEKIQAAYEFTVAERGEREPSKDWEAFLAISKAIREGSPKVTNKDGKEVNEYYIGKHYEKDDVNRENGKDFYKHTFENNNGYRVSQSCLDVFNHSGERVTVKMNEEGRVLGYGYYNFETKDSVPNIRRFEDLVSANPDFAAFIEKCTEGYTLPELMQSKTDKDGFINIPEELAEELDEVPFK